MAGLKRRDVGVVRTLEVKRGRKLKYKGKVAVGWEDMLDREKEGKDTGIGEWVEYEPNA